MNIYEYQAKAILKQYGVNVPEGKVAADAQESEKIAKEIGGPNWVVKAQVLTGGRGKAGGIKIAKTLAEVKQHAQDILSRSLRTYQSGDQARKVNKVLVEQCCSIAQEFYFAITIDRLRSNVVIIASSQGGVDIEQTARSNPSAIFKEYIDLLNGLMPYQMRNLAFKLGIKDKELLKQAVKFMSQFYKVFIGCDCLLAEINPLVITKENKIVALDAKLSFDDSALLRHQEFAQMRNIQEDSLAEKLARESNLSYIGLEGNIGCMVNGAGLAMATMDSIKIYGGQPANFLDVGGGASKEMVTQAFSILMSDKNIKVILVNIFGGILKCDLLAEGMVSASQKVKPNIPLVVRLEGTNVERGREILSNSGLNIISEKSMKAAAQKAVELAGENDKS